MQFPRITLVIYSAAIFGSNSHNSNSCGLQQNASPCPGARAQFAENYVPNGGFPRVKSRFRHIFELAVPLPHVRLDHEFFREGFAKRWSQKPKPAPIRNFAARENLRAPRDMNA
jgi:hypothetical protein